MRRAWGGGDEGKGRGECHLCLLSLDSASPFPSLACSGYTSDGGQQAPSCDTWDGEGWGHLGVLKLHLKPISSCLGGVILQDRATLHCASGPHGSHLGLACGELRDCCFRGSVSLGSWPEPHQRPRRHPFFEFSVETDSQHLSSGLSPHLPPCLLLLLLLHSPSLLGELPEGYN